jgi:hypothetical protein
MSRVRGREALLELVDGQPAGLAVGPQRGGHAFAILVGGADVGRRRHVRGHHIVPHLAPSGVAG